MNTNREKHSQSTLADGRVLVCGGTASPTQWAEIYDPEADEWTLATTLPLNMKASEFQKGALTHSTLVDGRVLVCDGGSATANITTLCRIRGLLRNPCPPSVAPTRNPPWQMAACSAAAGV